MRVNENATTYFVPRSLVRGARRLARGQLLVGGNNIAAAGVLKRRLYCGPLIGVRLGARERRARRGSRALEKVAGDLRGAERRFAAANLRRKFCQVSRKLYNSAN